MRGVARSLRSVRRSLSARLLVLTIAFVMLSEVLIYVPSIARFRLTYLEQRLAAAHLATLALLAAPENELTAELERELLINVGARAVVLKRPDTRFLMLSEDMPPKVDATFDLREASPWVLMRDSFAALLATRDRIIRVIDVAPRSRTALMEVVMEEAPLVAAMYDFSWRILTLSIVISLLTACLVYVSLHWLIVRPMRRITESMIRFRRAPEEAASVIVPGEREDEIGIARTELAEMQAELRAALRQKTRLAALGTAVSKINHDLRNVLATAQLVSDRLAASADPEVQRITPRLIGAIDRAINLCTRTLKYGRADEPPPERSWIRLRPLIDEVGDSVGLQPGAGIAWRNEVPRDLEVFADHDQMFRVFLNLARNAVQALAEGGEIRIRAIRRDGRVVVDVADDGPGLPEAAREHLFEPFTGSARAGGTGLGLAIARDLVRAHGGDIVLVESDSSGATFRIDLPDE